MSHEKYRLSPAEINILKPLIEFELYQSSAYVQCANVANKLGFKLAEAYYLKESKDERKHAMMHYEYITGRGSDFQMPAIEEPTIKAKSLYDLVEQVLKMEDEAANLYEKALKNAFGVSQMLYQFLLQFMEIQREAYQFNIDACTTLDGLDKAGELVAESKIFA